jgi:hypothetical protein
MRTPFIACCDSSFEMAKDVLFNMLRILLWDSVMDLSSPIFGSDGNSSASMPWILKKDDPLRRLVMFLSSVSISTSPSESSRNIRISLFMGTVVAPDVFTDASTEQVMAMLRSVAVNSRRPSLAQRNTLCRMEVPERPLTALCTASRPVSICFFVMFNFMSLPADAKGIV